MSSHTGPPFPHNYLPTTLRALELYIANLCTYLEGNPLEPGQRNIEKCIENSSFWC